MQICCDDIFTRHAGICVSARARSLGVYHSGFQPVRTQQSMVPRPGILSHQPCYQGRRWPWATTQRHRVADPRALHPMSPSPWPPGEILWGGTDVDVQQLLGSEDATRCSFRYRNVRQATSGMPSMWRRRVRGPQVSTLEIPWTWRGSPLPGVLLLPYRTRGRAGSKLTVEWTLTPEKSSAHRLIVDRNHQPVEVGKHGCKNCGAPELGKPWDRKWYWHGNYRRCNRCAHHILTLGSERPRPKREGCAACGAAEPIVTEEEAGAMGWRGSGTRRRCPACNPFLPGAIKAGCKN